MSDKYPGGFVTANAPAGFSVAFNGSSSYVISSGTPMPTSGDFTVECWIYPISVSGSFNLIWVGNASGSLGCAINSNGTITYGRTLIATDGTTSNAVTFNQWNHIAHVRSSGTIKIYINGVLGLTASNSTTYTSSAARLGSDANSTLYYNGYISNFRVTNTAVYTTTFTPPTQLFPISGTSILIAQSPTFIDNSTNALTITPTVATVSNFTPFAAYTGFNPALGAAAGGVWTLDEAAYYQNNRQWPIYDPYFNNTTLMLHGNGTNGAQNNTFLDSSTNNFTITRNGNTAQGSFSPFSQTGWSTRFDGSSDGFTIPSSSLNGAWVNSNFTYEAWLYVDNTNANNFFWLYGQNNNDALYLGLTISGSGVSRNINYGSFNGLSFNYSYSTTNNVWNMNEWFHVAFVRDSSASNVGAMKIFVNGVLVGQGNTGTFGVMNNSILWNNQIGGWANFPGYCGGLRLTNRALYSSNFTPERLTNVSGTLMLLCTDKTLTDNSANRYALTISGAPKVQAFSPFVPAYITPTTYSNWFDGSGDYLTVPDNANLELGSGDFTIECWINTTVSNGGYVSAVSKWGSSNQSYMIRAASTDIGSGWSFFYSTNGTNYFTVFGSSINDGGWHHVAVTRSGNVFTTFTDGVLKNTTTDAVTLYNGTSSVTIGAGDAGANPFTGLISNLRIVKGTALYTASFTPPTAPLTAVTNTQLLTCQSSTFIDNSANAATLTANGNVQPVTSPTPFPAKVDTTTLNSAYSTSLIGGSAYFDGSGDYLNFTDSSNALDLGGRAASIEAWVYTTTSSGIQHFIFKSGGGTDWNTSNGVEYAIAFQTNKFYFVYNSSGSATFINGSTTRSPNQWYHVAVATDASNNIALFVNGVRDGTATNAITKPTTRTSVYIGTNNSGTEAITGYVSGERFISGSGAYDPTKTVIALPTTPPTAVSGTQLLLNYTNGAIFDNTAKNVCETVGNAQISTTQSKWGGSSMYFDGTGDFLRYRLNDPIVFLGSGDWTIEGWVYLNSTSGDQSFLQGQSDYANAANASYSLYVTGSSAGNFFYGSTNISLGAPGLSVSTWTHCAWVRNGATITFYRNGTSITTVSIGTNAINNGTTNPTCVGAFNNGNNPLNGYIDDLRITKGVARYITNFTPPTSQLQDQ